MARRICSPFQAVSLNAIAAAIVVLAAGPAAATEFNFGNSDLSVRWDNTVRYNLGVRNDRQDPRILNSPSYDEGDAKFGRGDIVTNRLDLLSEVDLSYKSVVGGRLSAAAWYDQAYHDHKVTVPTSASGYSGQYFNNEYSSTVKRYVNGPSGEVLDAFVWTNFNIGPVPTNVKLGRHTIVWGEGLLLGDHAISYSQAPIDGVKASTSPGIETKEVFLPLNQISFKSQLTSDLSLAGQYFLQWRPTRAPNGGTFVAGADMSPEAVDQLPAAPGFNIRRVDGYHPPNRGNFGVALRWDATAIDTTFGAYYRKFDDYTPETGIQFPTLSGATPTSVRFAYAQNVDLIGFSLARPLGPVSFGTDVSVRRNAHLNSLSSYALVQATGQTGARGNTLHVVMNGIYLLPKTALWDTGSVTAEVGAAHLLKVTANANLYRAEGYASCRKTVGSTAPGDGDNTDTCSTRNFFAVAVNFAPQWLSILPSWDLTLPLSINYGLNGTSPTGAGGFEKLLRWSVGATAMYNGKHEFGFRYVDLDVPSKYNAANLLVGGNALGSSVGSTDRGWFSFTYKTSF